ncbi:hypothetical protein V1478_003982 [Vespula squamosa]|uniref:Uncharacterized protein n=1 Tax=Vespula squamosa TaxID=30214 RepID=A0ABD2BND5_VESSQ
MELTFLKLASPGPWRSTGASSVDGGNGSLGIALSISRPLDPHHPLALRPIFLLHDLQADFQELQNRTYNSLTNKLESFLFHNRDGGVVKMDDYTNYFIVGRSLFRSSNSDDAIKRSLINPTRESIILG